MVRKVSIENGFTSRLVVKVMETEKVASQEDDAGEKTSIHIPVRG